MVQGISEFFAGKTILLTGGTGFIGKVLIEKLLRSCPDIKRIYMVIRVKREKSIQERIKDITKVELFDILRADRPTIFEEKLFPIEGDMKGLRLGLSDEDYNRLIKEVDVVFHSAATVRFDQPLSEAYVTNTRSTKEMVDLACQMKRLQVFVHVSTTYSNCDRLEVDEVIYPEHADWREMGEIVDNVDQASLDILSRKLTALPNTYVFTKSLAEHIVNEYRNKLPIVIYRPAIVISSHKDPIPGWIDNFNGPVGLLIGIGKGLVRTSLTNKDIVMAYLPVDIAVKSIIIATWKRAVYGPMKPMIDIYNGASIEHSINFGQLQDFAAICVEENPLESCLWYYSNHISTNKLIYTLIVWFQQALPALIIDSILKLTGHKPLLFRIQIKIIQAQAALDYFFKSTWNFVNKNFMGLPKILLEKDKEAFSYDLDEIEPLDFFRSGVEGGKKYLLKEKVGPEHREMAKRRFKKMYYLHIIALTLWYAFLAWVVYKVFMAYRPHEYIMSV